MSYITCEGAWGATTPHAPSLDPPLLLGHLVTSAMTNFTLAKLTLLILMANMDAVDRMERGSLSVQELLRNQALVLVQGNT